MLKPNTELQNRYLIIRLLAEGGMGAVYEAMDRRLGNRVALKETFFVDEEMRRAFHREAALLAVLRHSALPKVIDHFNEGEGQFLVMEFIGGDDLARLAKMSGGPIPARDVMAWADQLLGVLEYLHSQRPSVIHRDIKPQNLKLSERGEIILLDFGLAKEAAHGTGAVNHSVRGYTLVYAPLEQIQGAGTDPRSDLYGAAATIYHLMTGVPPADALTRAAAFIEGKPDPLRPAHEVNPRVSPAISAVLTRTLSQDRSRRPQTAAIMRDQLRQAIAAGDAATVQQQPDLSTVPMPPPPVFHSQPERATPLNLQAESRSDEPRTTAGNGAPQTAAMTTSAGSRPAPYMPINIPPPSPGLPFKALETAPKSNQAILLVAGIAAIAAVLILSLFAPQIWSKKNSATSKSGIVSGTDSDASNFANATSLAGRELVLRGGPESRIYSFTAGPGELKLTLNVIGNGSTVTVEALDPEQKELRFTGEGSGLSVSSTGSNEQEEARLILDREQRILLALKTSYPDSLEALRLRIEGPAKLPETKSSSPLNSLFSARDTPKPLGYDTMFGGQGTPADTYYAFAAGPVEIKLALDVIGNGSTSQLELFNEKSRRINFANSESSFSVSSTGQQERRLTSLRLASREKLLLRIRTSYPDSLQAYRLKLEGPIDSVTTGAANPSSSGLASLFAMRDNPLPLNSKELSSSGLDKDYYYLLRAGPGTLTFEIEITANGSTFTVELFNADAKSLKFNNGSDKFSVSSTGNRESGKAEITLGSEEKVLMRISNTYPADLKKYRLKIEGAIKKASGE